MSDGEQWLGLSERLLFIDRCFMGLEKWLSGQESLMLLQETRVTVPAYTSGGSQPPVSPVPGALKPCGLFGHLHAYGAHKLKQANTHM